MHAGSVGALGEQSPKATPGVFQSPRHLTATQAETGPVGQALA